MRPAVIPWYGVGAICRSDGDLIDCVLDRRRWTELVVTSLVTVWVGAMAYGATFGSWRGGLQAWYASQKLPLLILFVTTTGALINAMLGQAMGARLSFRQIWLCMLIGLTIACALLGAFSPIIALFLAQMPSYAPAPGAVTKTYSMLLLWMTAGIGAAGLAGFSVLYRLLKRLTGSVAVALRILGAWTLVTGFVGSQISWYMSPFICRPEFEVTFLNPQAFDTNFYEQIFAALGSVF